MDQNESKKTSQEKRNRLIACLDTETTSDDPDTAEIIELCIIIVDSQLEEVSTPLTLRFKPRSNQVPMSSTRIHGITMEHLEDQAYFLDHANLLLEVLEDKDILAYNAMFDIRVLINEFHRCGIDFSMEDREVIDPLVTLRTMEPRDLTSTYLYYTGEMFDGAHGAEQDVMATIRVAKEQFKKYPSLKSTTDMYLLSNPENRLDLANKFVLKNGVKVFNFGPQYGEPISQHLGLLEWALKKDFPEETKKWIKNYLNKNK